MMKHKFPWHTDSKGGWVEIPSSLIAFRNLPLSDKTRLNEGKVYVDEDNDLDIVVEVLEEEGIEWAYIIEKRVERSTIHSFPSFNSPESISLETPRVGHFNKEPESNIQDETNQVENADDGCPFKNKF